MLKTTMGQLLVNEALPPDLRDYNRTLDKKNIEDVLRTVATKYPEKYREVSKSLSDVGREVAYLTGGNSFGLQHLRKANAARMAEQTIRAKLDKIMADPSLTGAARRQAVIDTVQSAQGALEKAIYKESLDEKNPLAIQVLSGARGSAKNLKSLRGSDALYEDHHGRIIPIPVLRSYSQGLTPAEYWAGAFGARKGIADVKLAVSNGGYFAKQLNQMAHRLLVTDRDHEEEPADAGLRGLPTTVDDPDNEGALLAQDVGGYKRNTVLTPRILKDLRDRGVEHMLVRSPMVGGPASGGVFARDVGVRERGGLAPIGDYVGNTAAQALAEKITQSTLSSKHSGGVAGAAKAVGGFKLINQLAQVPEHFQFGATHAQADGRVQSVVPAPQGGNYVTIGGQQHYVPPDLSVQVKVGDEIEAGDALSDGIPNPAEIVRHKGIGEGRRYFVDAFRRAFKDSGLSGHRRNIELASRGLIDHVRLTDELGDYNEGDIVPYSAIEQGYAARPDAKLVGARSAVGQYLEKPVLHYTVGTKVRPSMLPHLERFGVQQLHVHASPPPFEPEMVRAAGSIGHDPDWMTRMLGSGQKKSLLNAVHYGGVSDLAGTSYVHSLAEGSSFGKTGPTKGWDAGEVK